ncbi:hypothetical protein [Microcoleus sp. herbarium12]|uniref:hypothetical protein n=1 Tax=Microcoleus sp. herbarium12 TaxID=3055437 RepID=UPI002FD36DBD
MTTSIRLKTPAGNRSNSFRLVEKQLKPVAASAETTSGIFWENVLNVKTMPVARSENQVSNKTPEIKRSSRICWWM